MRSTITAATALALCCLSSVALADDQARSDEHFRKGAKLYHEGKYSDAILELKAGYELAPHPVFLVNIALAYAKLSNFDEAAAWGLRAAAGKGLEPDPHAQTAGRADAWLARSNAAAIATQMTVRVDEPTGEPQPPEAPAPQQKPTWLGWIGVGAVGLGLFNMTGAAITGAALQPTRNEYEIAAASGNREDYERLRDSINRTQRTGQILLFTGIGLFVAGGVVVIWDLSRDTEVAVGPGNISVRWVF